MKNKTRFFVTVLVLLICVAALPLFAAAEALPVRGDCNGDGAVNMKDVLFLRQYLAGTVTAFPAHDCFGVNRADVRGDCNADGAVNMKDTLTLRKWMAGLIESLPSCSCQEEAAIHTITVVSGTANVDEAMPGDTVSLTADLPDEGMEFDCWRCDGGYAVLDDANSELATFVMPNEAVSITATYTPIVYTVFATDCTVDNSHPNPGDTVTVTAIQPMAGDVFDGWIVSGVEIADTSGETVTFTMPSNNVTIIATFREA